MAKAQLYEDTNYMMWDFAKAKSVYPVVKLVRHATWVWELVRNHPDGFENETVWKDTHCACSFTREEILQRYPNMRKTL
jgi:hypothetical protein